MFAGPMVDNKVHVTVFFGGKFQVGLPLKYVGGRVDVVRIDLSNGSLSNITKAIEALTGHRIEKLFYRVPGSSILKDGVTLRYLWDNFGVIDLLYHYLHFENMKLYVEHVDDEETSTKIGGVEMKIRGLSNLNMESVDSVVGSLLKNVRYSVVEQRAIKYTKNTTRFVRARCAQTNYNRMIYGAFDNKTGSFHLKKYMDEHICSITFENKRVSSSCLAKHIMIIIFAMPKINAPQLKKLAREQLGVNVTLSQCRRTKLKVFKELQGNYKEYGQMYDYLEEL